MVPTSSCVHGFTTAVNCVLRTTVSSKLTAIRFPGAVVTFDEQESERMQSRQLRSEELDSVPLGAAHSMTSTKNVTFGVPIPPPSTCIQMVSLVMDVHGCFSFLYCVQQLQDIICTSETANHMCSSDTKLNAHNPMSM